jgi:adenine-specific DNA-methyltransferase
MNNLLDELKSTLLKDKRLAIKGELLKNKTVELAIELDKGLIKLLLSSKQIKSTFFTEVDGTIVFDKDKFIKFISNKQFLPDSYTSFKNKVGLVTDSEYFSEDKNVVLAWPYKDCVLEGGMEKEDEKRDEVFFNQTLAPDDIDRLLDPKVLTNFKMIDKKGEHNLEYLKRDEKGVIRDNLIIKGNNLLALSSIKKEFAGKAKLIYIDPPYNIGGDFQYNDRFNHSTWLTFMKNRLEVAHDLLAPDGAIFIQIDHHEVAYLNALMDEIFGSDNKVQIISVKVSAASGFKAVNPGPIDVTEFILFYTRNKSNFVFQKNYVETGYHKNYNLYLDNKGKIENWKLLPLKDKVLKDNGYKNEKEIQAKYGNASDLVLLRLISDFAFANAKNVVSIRDLHKPSDKVKALQNKSRIERDKFIPYKKQDGSYAYLINGGALAFYSSKIREIDGELKVTELLTNYWDHISWAGIASEGGVKLKNGKKPEKLIKQVFEVAGVKNHDIVIDFFLGSGTTCAVAHKLNIQYIGIEQLNYENNDAVIRLKNVIGGDESGISKTVKWQGGGGFVYMELARWNQEWIDKIHKAKTTKELLQLWTVMKQKAFLSYKVLPEKFEKDAKTFEKLSLVNQKCFLMECIDKNQLYVNLSEIDDEDYHISEKDKKLNNKFYNK